MHHFLLRHWRRLKSVMGRVALVGLAATPSLAADPVAPNTGDKANWHIKWELRKYDSHRDGTPLPAQPDEIVTVERNLLMYGGASCLWECLIGNGTATAGQALTYFNNAQAAIGAGDSATAAVATQTDLQASSNKFRAAMDATFPTHTDGVVSGSATIVFAADFTNAQANYVWNEVAIFNSTSAGVGRMLNRLTTGWGTKASGTWTMTVTITIS